jgi:F-type H+-transporting ATPase subunit delta
MIHAASRQALAMVRERLEAVLGSLPADGGQSHARLATELYAVANLLAGQSRLRRILADPSTESSRRIEVAASLLAGKISDATLDVVRTAVAQRWSSAWDLIDCFEQGADEALFAAAEQQGQLDEVEDNLFRFERVLSQHGELTGALDEAAAPAEARIQLLRDVLDGKANPIAIELLSHAVASRRKRHLESAIDDLLELSAARRERSVARVISATELTEQQSTRLGSALSALYGRAITVRSAVDNRVKGGLAVRVGDEVIDGTVAKRLADARAALAG